MLFWLQTLQGPGQLDAVEIAAADARLMETGDMTTWEWSMQHLISSEAQAKAVSQLTNPETSIVGRYIKLLEI